MKSRLWMARVVAGLLVGGPWGASGASYYVNDADPTGDVYTSNTGNNANPGTAALPKLTVGNVIATCNLQPGDVVYVDTGVYAPAVISNTVVGTAGSPILFQGSTSATHRTIFTGGGTILSVSAQYAHFRDIWCVGGSYGIGLSGVANCVFERVHSISNGTVSVQSFGVANSNVFRRCIQNGTIMAFSVTSGRDNYLEHCVGISPNTFVTSTGGAFSNVYGCVVLAKSAFLQQVFVPPAGSRNVFFTSGDFYDTCGTLVDFQKRHTNWTGNTYADPKFANAAAFDFHLLSAAGFISNGVWTTNAAVGSSPAIDFGRVGDLGYTNEPSPNGGRVNVGLYGGTAEASKSNTNGWLFAMSFNDGGNLVQTGKLEWVAGNLGAGTVDLQFSTNNGTGWSNIATGVAATNESYVWVPSVSRPAVLWRVVSSTNSAIAATNAKAFSVRTATNTTFNFYVNDASTNNDVFCSATGSDGNSGVFSNSPKRGLQAILDAYDLEGGDTVYVDTGDYLTNVTATINPFDSGLAGVPVRIVGSPKGAVLNRGNTSSNTLEIVGALHLEISNLRLTGGRAGLAGTGGTNVLRNVQFSGNLFGVDLTGRQYLFENCLAVNNDYCAFSGSGSGSNRWNNGILWGNPTGIAAQATTLMVSNSILGGGTVLFGQAVVPGDYNLVWQTGVGLTYATFSALQNAGLGWTRSLYADPQFANLAGGDYHLKSLMGRYDPATGNFATNDAVHSPAIDLGDPASQAYTNEMPPNGGRLNSGLFGGTAQASKSRTNAWLQTLSYMDGGTFDAPQGSWLRWNGTNYPAGSTVTIWLSRDSGMSWEALSTNLAAASGQYFYQNTSTNDSSTTNAAWRVSLNADTNVSSWTTVDFTYKNGPFIYYVNDGATNGDVYCTAIGNNANPGTSAGAPMASLAEVLSRKQLTPGDRVYVDTGVYYFPAAPVVFTSQDSGAATNQVLIQGSTNRLAGGSQFGQSLVGMDLAFDFRAGASNVVLRDFVVQNAARGVAISNAADIKLENVEVRRSSDKAFDLQPNARSIELSRCVAHGGGIGIALQQASNVVVRHAVLWQNTNAAVHLGTSIGLRLENSILASTATNSVLLSLAATNGLVSDYNGLHAGSDVRVGVNRTTGLRADNLAAWQALSGGQDASSVPGDPQLADPNQFDYHLKTEHTRGRWLPNGDRTSDPVSSPLLDAGNPTNSFALELEPNGGRINIGKFGGTAEASIAVPSPWLKAISYGDAGGVVDGPVALRWLAGGGFSNETVKVQVSLDGGKTWGTNVVSGVAATNGVAQWTVGGLPDTPAAVWRVVCLERTNVTAQSASFFAIRNQPLRLFLATADTNDTVYTTAPGLADNWRAASNAPLNSLAAAFERFDLEPGDQIWVDSGTYAESVPVRVGMKDSGTSNNPVRVIGNAKEPFRASVLKRTARTAGTYGVQLANVEGIQFGSLMVSNAWTGILAEGSRAISLDRIRVGYCVNSSIQVGTNSSVSLTGTIVEQSLAAGLQATTGAVVKVYNCLMRDNDQANVLLSGGNVEVKNSILQARGTGRFIYYRTASGPLASDFNNVRVAEAAYVAGGAGQSADRFLIDWQISSGFSNDVSSFGYDPLFHDEAGLDFHLQSQFGRYDPLVGGYVYSDTNTSRLIDLGDPASSFANEPVTNGSRINVGLYGNSAEASKSSGQGSLVPLTMSDGGTIRGLAKLYWSFNGLSNNTIVSVQFSDDGGSTWTNIATNIYVDVGSSGLPWDTTNFTSTAQGVWRVLTTTNVPPIIGQTENPFALKNEPLAYYVNDASTNGDVYCSARGRASNTGLSADSPLDSLETLLGRYKVEHGDTVYVDTGLYRRSAPLEISIPSAAATNRLVIQGSTNEAAGGTVFTNANGAVIDLQDSRLVDLRDFNLHGGSSGLRLTKSSSNRLWRIRSAGARVTAFDLGLQSDQNQFIQCAAISFSMTGFHVATPQSSLEGAPTTNYWIHGVIAGIPADTNGMAVATNALMVAKSGRVYVSNSVFVANGPTHTIYVVAPETIRGDYNCYHQPFSSALAWVSAGTPAFGVETRIPGSLGEWSAWMLSDSNSFAADPLFADLAAGDLHPKSQGGRYSPASDSFVADEETSPLIDTADPLAPWSLEPEPHGRRADLGVYGNHFHGSRSPTNASYVLLSLNQGGVVRGTQALRWVARGAATNAGRNVNVHLSVDGGVNYNQLLGVSAATQGVFTWNSTGALSLATARWRVRDQGEGSWVAAAERDFVIHNSNLTYYVNDAATNGDVYATAPGALNHTGLSPSSPLSSLHDVLSRYDVEPGDLIRIDTGNYALTAPVSVGFPDSGTAAEPVRIQGSTNALGSSFVGAGLQFANARGVTLRNLAFASQTGVEVVSIASSDEIGLEEVDLLGGPGNGVQITLSSNVWLRNVLVVGMGTNGISSQGSYNTRLDFGTVWGNVQSQIEIRNQPRNSIFMGARETSFIAVSNTILGASGPRKPVYEIRGNLLANDNNLYLTDGALAGLSYAANFGREFDSVQAWASASSNDTRSLSHEPRFANPAARDYHLKSSMGRYDPAVTNFVLDPASENSPLIDAGAKSVPCTEPAPNGARVNLGRYGNTAQASKTPTNPALALISFHDGGRAAGTVPIYWNARGYTTNAGVTVTISYSANAGSTWTTLVSGVSAAAGQWLWNTVNSAQSVQAMLRIVGTDGSQDQSAELFSLRNAPFSFYVNDGSTNRDVYCTAVGNDGNSGLTNSQPMADLNSLLARYDLDSGDVVYIDTGVYQGLNPWRISQSDSAGELGLPPVVFQGSTNSLLGGTVLDRQGDRMGIQVDYAVGVALRNIAISNTVESAVWFNDCYQTEAEGLAVVNGNVGFRLTAGSLLRVARSLVLGSKQGVGVENWTRATNTVFPVIEHNVIWETVGSAIQIGGENQATVRNNVLSVTPGQYVYRLGFNDAVTADYNAIWLESGDRVFRRDQERSISPVPIIYETVGAWAAATGQDVHSYAGDPLLANPVAGDFHLRSRAGRYVPGTGWTNDAVSSPLIDAGTPSSAEWMAEPGPNGGRVNIGLYGGTPWASKTATNSALHLLTLDRGGVASGQVALNWRAAGQATGHTVRLEVTVDDGLNWVRVADGVPATAGGAFWNSLTLPSSPLARWRVQDEQESGVAAMSALNFVLHNQPIRYYVNDEFSDSSDFICTAPGNSTNSGISPNSPKRWISEIVDAYNLEPGDVVYVDTGRYQTPTPTIIGDLDAGGISQDPSQQVTFLGSTNVLAGGSLYIITDPEKAGFQLAGAHGIRFSRLGIQGAGNGLDLSNSFFIAGDGITIRGCENGAVINQSSNVLFSRSALVGNRNAGVHFYGSDRQGMQMDACVLWSNRYGIYLQQGYVQASNSIFGMVVPDAFGYYKRADAPQTGIQSDYNNLYVQQASAAVAGFQIGSAGNARTTVYSTVAAWTTATGQDSSSLANNPELANPGALDFHLKSLAGRYQPGVGWLNDTNSSPLIDAGHPGMTNWTAEPDPNGRRLNIGIHGGTAEASKSISSGWIIPVCLNDGGEASGDVELCWIVGGAATNYSVYVEFSRDDGLTWPYVLTNHFPAKNGSFVWNSRTYGSTALGRWRVTCHEDPSIAGTSLKRFILRNPPCEGCPPSISYYVNDSSTNGDVYCTAPGNEANDGLTPATPKAGLQAILDAWQLAPEDVVYVDAGIYPAGAPPIKIDQTDSGYSNLYVTIQGSTNPAARTIFQGAGFSVPQAFSLKYAVNVRLKDLTIRNASVGVEAFQTIGCEFDNVRVEYNYNMGMDLQKNENFRLIRSVLWNNKNPTGGVGIAMAETTLALENSVIWGSPIAITLANSAAVTATNSVLQALGTAGRIYQYALTASAAGFRGDYNSYSRRNGALICEQKRLTGGSDFYNYMPSWSAATFSDLHSLTADPLFANETEGDFHPRSPQGRFDDALGAWTSDLPPLSDLVDAGSPAMAFDNEPEPNGGYIDIGAYGNTKYASKTQTNPPWLRAISYHEPGIISGDALLYWLHGGMPANARVRLDYSFDKISWSPIASNRPAADREYLWNVNSLPLSRTLYWRVTYLANTNVFSIAGPTTVKPGNFTFYVNDASTNGDVWCKGPGLPCDAGANPTNPATPAESLACLLAQFPVGAGDRVYVDTGVYPATDAERIVIDGRHAGSESKGPLKLFGSTNTLAGGALFVGNGSANGMDVQNTRLIELHDFRFTQAQNGLALLSAANVALHRVEAFNNRSNGIWTSSSSEVEVRNARLWKNGWYGYAAIGNLGGQSLWNATLWGNTLGAAYNNQATLAVSNSILCMTNARPVYFEESSGNLVGDYNLYGVVPGGLIGSNSFERAAYANLRQWQSKARDAHSMVLDPLFVNPAAGDFHLQSRAGYRSNGTWAVSADTSWAIDAGDPASTAHTNEPSPNGGRLNLGAYGGTPEASRSDSSVPEVLPISLRDGGVAPNGQPLEWLYRGIAPASLVRLEYSPDKGASWVLVTAGLGIDTTPYNWFSAFEPSPEARWRIVLQANTNVWGATPTNFIFRPVPITYYVNDSSTNRDVYTTAPGAVTNLGYSSNSPLPSLEAVLVDKKFQLISDALGGDQIKVDTGTYLVSNTVVVTLINSGNATNRTGILGSTNLVGGGSWLQPAPGMGGPAFTILGRHFNLSNLRMSGFTNGVTFNLASDCTLSGLDIQGSQGPGVLLQLARNVQLERVLIREGLTNALLAGSSIDVGLDSCVLWSNQWHALQADSSIVSMTNSVVEASGVGRYCYYSITSTTFRADYNDLFVRNGAQVASILGLQYDKLPQWVKGTAQDLHSLSTDPLFHDPANGDFHLRSQAGRYNPTNGWEQDVPPPAMSAPIRLSNPCGGIDPGDTNVWLPFSPLIDMGAPQAAWSNEPSPNGGRRNIGLHGNTWQASKSNTNRWLLAVSAMSGGVTYGRINLIWGYSPSIPTNLLARLEYSFDNGTTWSRIGEATVQAGEYVWDSDEKLAGREKWQSSPAGRWRIFLLTDTNVWDVTETHFGLRNSPFKYYLNDASTNNDVYSTAAGDDCNLGFYPAAPKLTLNSLLENIDLDATDELYVDTGIYRMTDTNAPIRWDAADGGASNQPVVVRGSTNANGSIFIATNRFNGPGFFFSEASYLDLQDLQFSGESMEFKGVGLNVRNLGLTNGSMRIYTDRSAFAGVQVDRGSVIVSGQGNRLERMQQRWGAMTILGTNISLSHSSVFSTNSAAVGILVDAVSAAITNTTVVAPLGTAIAKRGPGTLRLSHNVLVAGGSDANSVISWEAGGLISDWNNLLARGSAWIGSRDGKWEKLAYWQAASGQDANSVSFEPKFQNENSGDFHLKSVVGRWSPLLNLWDADSEHSPVIDLGDPWIGTKDEPQPNGYRRNLGAYGGTEQASKSRTNFWLTALTQNDGGVLKGSNVVLRWAASNNASSTVRLDYYDGTTWTNIASGLLASWGSYTWDTTGFPDSFSARWRVVSEDDTNVWDQTDSTFPLRNHVQAFYVNDDSRTGDIYCSTNGSAAHDGLTPATPKLSLQAILDTYDLEGGDTVWIDTGTYPAASDVRIIWSRGGDTNSDVVIQGNTNGAHSVFTRTGATNFPAVGIDVKASRIQLNHLAVQDVDRGILLDSNRNVSIQGTVVSRAATGVSADYSQNAQIRNSAFHRTGIGVSLANTRTSVLENLTFAWPTIAGIQLSSTVVDTLQNNIFVPDTNAYAYAIGTATSLLTSAFMDYNLYDFSSEGSGFHAGAPASTNLRRWQVGNVEGTPPRYPGMYKDFRSAVAAADLANLDLGDFHPKSQYGRWASTNSWVNDATTSWAVDHGNPDQGYEREPMDNGARRNIGMHGNTPQASKGTTNVFLDTRTLMESDLTINPNDKTWPLVWDAHMVDPAQRVRVEFSADSGATWIELTNVNAYAEYFIFEARPEFQTVNGRWRVIADPEENLVSTNCCDFYVKWFDLGFLAPGPKPVNGLMRMEWVGGVGGLRYRMEYSDDFGKTWSVWEEKYNGPASINRTDFVIPSGGAKNSYLFEDRTSYLRRTRWYRIQEFKN